MQADMTLLAALLAGLAGSGHCLAMCGGMAGLLAARQHRERPLRQALSYNLGRVTSYVLAGTIVATLGKLLVLGSGLQLLAGQLRLLAGIIIVIAGLSLCFGNRLFGVFEAVGSRFWKRISPLAVRALGSGSSELNVLWLGLLWGWLPCGMTYAMLATAAATAEPLHGAALMAAFGIGTLPAMVVTGVSGMRLREWLRVASLRQVAGVLLVIAGVWTMQPWKYLDSPGSEQPATHEHGTHATQG